MVYFRLCRVRRPSSLRPRTRAAFGARHCKTVVGARALARVARHHVSFFLLERNGNLETHHKKKLYRWIFLTGVIKKLWLWELKNVLRRLVLNFYRNFDIHSHILKTITVGKKMLQKLFLMSINAELTDRIKKRSTNRGESTRIFRS